MIKWEKLEFIHSSRRVLLNILADLSPIVLAHISDITVSITITNEWCRQVSIQQTKEVVNRTVGYIPKFPQPI